MVWVFWAFGVLWLVGFCLLCFVCMCVFGLLFVFYSLFFHVISPTKRSRAQSQMRSGGAICDKAIRGAEGLATRGAEGILVWRQHSPFARHKILRLK